MSTITFDEVTATGNPAISVLTIDEFTFSSDRFHTVADPGAGTLIQVDNGTIYIAEEAGGLGGPITIQQTNGEPFSLLGFDGAEGFLDDALAAYFEFPNAVTIEVTAVPFEGGEVTQSFTLDGLKDGLGGVADFQSFELPIGFENIISATFTGRRPNGEGAVALDNVIVAPVPEPTSFGLVFAALASSAIVLGAGIDRLKKNKSDSG